MPDIEQITSMAIQLPIVGLFIWVVFKFMADHRQERENAAKEHREERATLLKAMNNSMDNSATAIRELSNSTTELRDQIKEWRKDGHTRQP